MPVPPQRYTTNKSQCNTTRAGPRYPLFHTTPIRTDTDMHTHLRNTRQRHPSGKDRSARGLKEAPKAGKVGSSSSKRNSIAASRRHRLSDGLHSIASSLSLWPGEMTDQQQQQLQQQQPHQHSLQHFQHILRNDSGSDFLNLNPHAKLRHYSLTEMTTNFIRKPGSVGLGLGAGLSGTGGNLNSLAATTSSDHRYPSMNGRSSSYGSLE